ALDRMKETYACANGLQGDGKLDHFGEQGRIRGSVLMLNLNPARVRLDVMSSFNTVVYSLASDGDQFQMLDMQEKRFLYGPATACNLARMTQLEVPGHVLVSLLRGEAPLLVHPRDAATVAWVDDRFRVTIPSKHDARQVVELRPHPADRERPWNEQRVHVLRVQTFQADVLLYDAQLSDHQLASTAPPREDEDGIAPDVPPSGGPCDIDIPRKIRVEVPATRNDVLFEYESVALNPPIVEGTFALNETPGTLEQYVTCGQEERSSPPAPAPGRR
ncbi:MAG: hypothetical protein AAGN82_14870, partial [Myxococcota bacterium]